MSIDKRYWFGRKRFGWGWGPRSWEGWLTVIVYALLMATLPFFLGSELGDSGVRNVRIGLTVLFFAVFFWKLERSWLR